MILRKLNYFIESKRVEENPFWKFLIIQKDLIYLPVHYLCMVKSCRDFFYRTFGTTGQYEPCNRGIVSHKHKFIYYYVPKVASTSIKKSLAQLLFDRDIENRVHTFWFDEVMDVRSDDYGDYFKFSFVRNPWDRIVSCYCDKILHKKHTNYKYKNGVFRRFRKRYGYLFYMGMSFEDFVGVVSAIPDEDADRHFRSQYVYHKDCESNSIVDYVGKFENLQHDLKCIQERTNLPEIELPLENKSERDLDYRTFYTEKSKNMVAERYREDIALFDYQF